MKKRDFCQLIKPLTEKLYRVAYALVSDDLQAEQLVIDAFNAYLIKHKKQILAAENLENLSKKNLLLKRRQHFKGILFYLHQIGVRRALHLYDRPGLNQAQNFRGFFDLDPKVRVALSLRYDFQFNVDEIVDITEMPRYEVIEKLHNGRFQLLSNVNSGVLP
jgi:hypothetical protein